MSILKITRKDNEFKLPKIVYMNTENCEKSKIRKVIFTKMDKTNIEKIKDEEETFRGIRSISTNKIKQKPFSMINIYKDSEPGRKHDYFNFLIEKNRKSQNNIKTKNYFISFHKNKSENTASEVKNQTVTKSICTNIIKQNEKLQILKIPKSLYLQDCLKVNDNRKNILLSTSYLVKKLRESVKIENVNGKLRNLNF